MTVPTWQQVANRLQVTAQPTVTVLYGPVQAGQFDEEVFAEIINDDVAQVVHGWLQTASASAGPWRSASGASLEGIQPSDKLDDYIKVRGLPWWRIVALASGAGAVCRTTIRILRRG